MPDMSGQFIKGYQLQERIGAGGFGAVYRAHQSTVGREVAIKIILPGLANQPEFIRRFESEAQLIARLEHLHIVPLFDYWRDPDGAYLVMRWLRGGSLRDALSKVRTAKRPSGRCSCAWSRWARDRRIPGCGCRVRSYWRSMATAPT